MYIPSGVINILKPPGPTSQDVVTDVKRLLKVKKVGHAGTLDPGAAGGLSVCVGKATRLFDYLVDKDKRYRFEIQFGIATDTLDSYGRLTQQRDTPPLDAPTVAAALDAFLGVQEQQPPLFSAVKLDGQSLHRLARQQPDQQKAAAMRQKKARNICIHSFSLLQQSAPNRFLFDLHCSKGTYVRVVAEDLARQLGSIATVTFLLRTQSGAYDLEDSISLDELRHAAEHGQLKDAIQPMEQALTAYPALQTPNSCFDKLRNGNAIHLDAPAPAGLLRVFCRGQFFGLGRVERQELSMERMLWEETPVLP